MKKVLFYGDSNTYGFDPRGFLGMRYPEEIRWTSRVRDHFKGKYEIIEEGQNGRCLPDLPQEEEYLKRITAQLTKEDILFVMLGTNDILLTDHPDADAAIRKMETFTNWLINNKSHPKIIVAGPVPISDGSFDMQIYHDESIRMNAGFESICKGKGISYFDAADWDISLAYDGVHFSEEGSRKFADEVIRILGDA